MKENDMVIKETIENRSQEVIGQLQKEIEASGFL